MVYFPIHFKLQWVHCIVLELACISAVSELSFLKPTVIWFDNDYHASIRMIVSQLSHLLKRPLTNYWTFPLIVILIVSRLSCHLEVYTLCALGPLIVILIVSRLSCHLEVYTLCALGPLIVILIVSRLSCHLEVYTLCALGYKTTRAIYTALLTSRH